MRAVGGAERPLGSRTGLWSTSGFHWVDICTSAKGLGQAVVGTVALRTPRGRGSLGSLRNSRALLDPRTVSGLNEDEAKGLSSLLVCILLLEPRDSG